MLKCARKYCRAVLGVFIILMSWNCAFAQSGSYFRADPPYNTVEYGVDKLLDLYQFTAKADMMFDSEYGKFNVYQDYTGTGINTGEKYFRDNENFYLQYTAKIADDLSISFNQNISYISDAKSDRSSELVHSGSLLGLKYMLSPGTYIHGRGGIEYYDQIGKIDRSSIFNLQALSEDYEFEGYKLNGKFFAEYISLSDNRRNRDLNLDMSLQKIYGESDNLDISLNYKNQGRDILQSVTTKSPIETRGESRLGVNVNTGFGIFGGLRGLMQFGIENAYINRDFNYQVMTNDYTSITREANELNMKIDLSTMYASDKILASTGVNYEIKNEQNSVYEKYSLPINSLDILRSSEKLRDYQSSRINLFGRAAYNITESDTLSGNLSASIRKYDTPSDENYDDRDELNSIGNMNYTHRFSDNLLMNLKFEGYYKHLVYIKSQRSSNNNTNRVLAFSPSVSYCIDGFSMNPQFEVLANYTVYDFEETVSGVRSYSYRQLSYKDTINLRLLRNISLESRISARYYERSILFWDDFAETPLVGSLEFYLRSLVSYQIYDEIILRGGMRFYRLTQEALSVGSEAYSRNVYSPEINFIYQFSGGSVVNVSGWYDFRFYNQIRQKSIVNLFVFAKINF